MRQGQGTMGARWAAVAQVVVALGDELSIESLIGRTLDQVLVVLRADLAGLYVLNSADGRLELIAERGLPPDLVEEISLVDLDESTLIGRVALSAQMQYIEDIGTLRLDSDLMRELINREGLRSMAAIPLRAHGQVVGMIVCATRAQLRYDQSEEAIIEVISHALAAGILNARAFDAEKRLRGALQAADEASLAIAAELDPRRVLQAIVDRARDVSGARYAALGIGTDATKSFEPWVFSGLDEQVARAIGNHPRPLGLLGAVPSEGKTIRVRDMASDPRFRGWPANHPHMGSFLGMPIRVRGEVVGNLYLTDKVGAAEFTAEDEQAVSALASHAAVAYRHAQLFEQVQLERRRLEALVENSPLAIIFVEAESGYTYANQAAEELFGGPIFPLNGRAGYVAQIYRPDGNVSLSVDELPSTRALKGEPVVGMEVVVRRNDGREVPVIVSAAPISGKNGGVSGAVVLLQDVSPLKLEQLREEFISLVAHELRAPIAVIAGYADLMARRPQGDTETRALQSIRVSTRRLERLVQDLLDASRIEARRLQLETQTVNVGTLVKEVVERLREVLTERVVAVDVADGVPVVEADPGRIEQVLINLLTNASKYSPADSTIHVSVRAYEEEVVMSVHNDGPPISPEELPRLFTRFYRIRAERTRAPGIGLGLYIARGLVEAHGGRIWATSTASGGTTFCVALPKGASE